MEMEVHSERIATQPIEKLKEAQPVVKEAQSAVMKMEGHQQ